MRTKPKFKITCPGCEFLGHFHSYDVCYCNRIKKLVLCSAPSSGYTLRPSEITKDHSSLMKAARSAMMLLIKVKE